ncbi:MAG: tetratricopeptide repeat protein [Armatimonadetes bacterium]|nr:tetratricopeptide repeat protein [Armatimonadota bacterium]
MAAPTWKIKTFGSFEVTSKDAVAKFRTRKTADLVALLVIRPGEQLSRECLAALCWPDSDASRQSLRMAISDIRSVLGEDAVLADRDRVGLNAGRVSVDVVLFEKLTREKRFREALDLVQGLFLEGHEEDWVVPERLRLTDMIATAAVSMLADDPGDENASVAKRILTVVGCREDIHIALMQAYVRRGQTTLAIAQFEELERQLDELWGEPPSQAAVDVLESAPRPRVASINRPSWRHQLVGREALIDDVVTTLSQANLVTLIGPGGSGKTSLARAVMNEVEGTTWFVDLTPETTATGAARAIQTALGLPHAEQSEAIPAVARFLRSHPGLLVLDNFEQLAAVATPMVEALAKDGQILVTSRVELGLRGEILKRVGPLDLPKMGASLEEVRLSPAVSVFEHRARAANDSFTVTGDNAPSVVELCRRLDGLPLAIELAAARVVVHSPAQILASIQRSMSAIDSRQTSGVDRHSSLDRTIAWSFDLLDDDSRLAALASSLFAGPFTEIDVATLLPNTNLTKALETLVRSSVINADTSSDVARYSMLETIRICIPNLAENRNEFQPRFLACMAHKAREVEEGDLRYEERLRRHQSQLANYFAALDFFVESRASIPIGIRLALDLMPAAAVYALGDRLGAVLTTILTWPNDEIDPALRAQVVMASLNLSANTDDLDQSIALTQAQLPKVAGNLKLETQAKLQLASLYKSRGRYEEAMTLLDWSIGHFDDLSHHERARALYLAGLTACCMGEHVRSLDYHLEALKHARKGGDRAQLIRILFDVGSELAHLGRSEESLELFDEAVEHCEILDSRKLEGLTRWQQGDALLYMNRPEDAVPILQRSIELVMEVGFKAALKWIFLKMGEALAKCGQPVTAVRLFGKAVETRNAESRPLAVYEQNDLDKTMEIVRGQLSQNAIDRHWSEGAQASWEELIEEALSAGVPTASPM